MFLMQLYVRYLECFPLFSLWFLKFWLAPFVNVNATIAFNVKMKYIINNIRCTRAGCASLSSINCARMSSTQAMTFRLCDICQNQNMLILQKQAVLRSGKIKSNESNNIFFLCFYFIYQNWLNGTFNKIIFSNLLFHILVLEEIHSIFLFYKTFNSISFVIVRRWETKVY